MKKCPSLYLDYLYNWRRSIRFRDNNIRNHGCFIRTLIIFNLPGKYEQKTERDKQKNKSLFSWWEKQRDRIRLYDVFDKSAFFGNRIIRNMDYPATIRPVLVGWYKNRWRLKGNRIIRDRSAWWRMNESGRFWSDFMTYDRSRLFGNRIIQIRSPWCRINEDYPENGLSGYNPADLGQKW